MTDGRAPVFPFVSDPSLPCHSCRRHHHCCYCHDTSTHEPTYRNPPPNNTTNRRGPERHKLHGSHRRLLKSRGRRQGPRVAPDHDGGGHRPRGIAATQLAYLRRTRVTQNSAPRVEGRPRHRRRRSSFLPFFFPPFPSDASFFPL